MSLNKDRIVSEVFGVSLFLDCTCDAVIDMLFMFPFDVVTAMLAVSPFG
jgi:hypothetical protein